MFYAGFVLPLVIDERLFPVVGTFLCLSWAYRRTPRICKSRLEEYFDVSVRRDEASMKEPRMSENWDSRAEGIIVFREMKIVNEYFILVFLSFSR